MASATSSALPGLLIGNMGDTRSIRPGGWISVSITPGETALTRMPSLATSRATPTTMASTPAFAAAYQTHSLAPPRVAAIDETITTEPPLPLCLVDMRRTQARRQSMRSEERRGGKEGIGG